MERTLKFMILALLVIGSACTSHAQEDDGKIRIKITKKIDGEMKTFEGEYSSEEEMRNDPAYQEFNGSDSDNFAMIWGGDGDKKGIWKFHNGSGAKAFNFSFDEEDFMPHPFMKDFKMRHGGPNVFWFGDEEAMAFDHKEYEKKMEEKMKALEERMKGLDKGLQEEIMKTMREIEEMNAGMMKPRGFKGGVRIEDAGDDFGKKGVVEPKDKLELNDVNFMVTGKRLNFRFRIKEEGEMSVKISNTSGKEIYSRYFEKFAGTFSDDIDFKNQTEGKYLLEITHGKKRLTKKIVIE